MVSSEKPMSEDRLQQECFLWYHSTYPEYRGLLFHVGNGGSRSAREGAKFKTMGVWAGVSDFIFLFDSRAYFIELKTLKGTQSIKQKVWEQQVKNQGFQYSIIRSLEEFKSLIKEILSS